MSGNLHPFNPHRRASQSTGLTGAVSNQLHVPSVQGHTTNRARRHIDSRRTVKPAHIIHGHRSPAHSSAGKADPHAYAPTNSAVISNYLGILIGHPDQSPTTLGDHHIHASAATDRRGKPASAAPGFRAHHASQVPCDKYAASTESPEPADEYRLPSTG